MSEDLEDWWIAGNVAPLYGQPGLNLEMTRNLKTDEVNNIRYSNSIIRNHVNAESYFKIVDLFFEIAACHDSEMHPIRKVAEINRRLSQLGGYTQTFMVETRDKLGIQDGNSAFDPEDIRAVFNSTISTDEFQILLKIGRIGQGLLEFDEESASLSVNLSLNPESPFHSAENLLQHIENGIAHAQTLLGLSLESESKNINDAALRLRLIAAEVVDGIPMLVQRARSSPEAQSSEPQDLKFEELAINEAVVLHRAIKQSRSLRTNKDSAEETNSQATEELSTGADPSASDEETFTHLKKEITPADSALTESGPIDLRALAGYATELTNDYEMAWSNAIDSLELASAQESIRARHASLIQSIQRIADESDDRMKSLGLSAKIERYPIPTSWLKNIKADPTLQEELSHLMIAQLDVLHDLLTAMKALQEPSGFRLNLATGASENWWEAGAFRLVQDQADLLVDVTNKIQSIQSQLEGGPASPESPMRCLILARSAIRHGDMEASLLHIWRALRKSRFKNSIDHPDFVDQVSNEAQLAKEAAALPLLRNAVEKIYRGEELGIGIAILAAPRAFNLVWRICFDPTVLREFSDQPEGEQQGA